MVVYQKSLKFNLRWEKYNTLITKKYDTLNYNRQKTFGTIPKKNPWKNVALYYNNRNLIQLNTTVTVWLGTLGEKLWNFGEKNYDTILKTIELCFTMEKLCCNEKISLLFFFFVRSTTVYQ